MVWFIQLLHQGDRSIGIVCDAMLVILTIPFTLQVRNQAGLTDVPGTKWIAVDGHAMRIVVQVKAQKQEQEGGYSRRCK